MTSTHSDAAVTEQLDPVVLRARQRVGQVLRQEWRLGVLLGVGGMAAEYAVVMGPLRGIPVEALWERRGRRLPGQP